MCLLNIPFGDISYNTVISDYLERNILMIPCRGKLSEKASTFETTCVIGKRTLES